MGATDERGRTWDDLLEDLLDEEVDREDEIELALSEVTVDVPMAFGEDAEHATWRFDGSVTVTVDGTRGPLADWVRYWRDRAEGE